jgi:hypothetical protein
VKTLFEVIDELNRTRFIVLYETEVALDALQKVTLAVNVKLVKNSYVVNFRKVTEQELQEIKDISQEVSGFAT